MTNEKFIHDTKTVLKFIQIHCDDKHKNEIKKQESIDLNYKDKELHVELDYNLCVACKKTFFTSYRNLQSCPHEEKPSCRKCPNPCYERQTWKELAKIMRYSGMKLGFLKIKRLFRKPSV